MARFFLFRPLPGDGTRHAHWERLMVLVETW
jgi:hypothetical protein